MTNDASVVDGVVRWEAGGRLVTIDRGPSAEAGTAAPPRSGPVAGRIPVRANLTDPAVVRIAVLAVGIAALLLVIATVL
jgi:hypothetical protein